MKYCVFCILRSFCIKTFIKLGSLKNIYINLKDKIVTMELFGFTAKMLRIGGGGIKYIKVKDDIT